MTRAFATAGLGIVLLLAGAAFDSPSLFVPGLALCGLSLAAVAWVELAVAGASVERRLGASSVEEEQPYPVRVEVRSGVLPVPAGELREPLVDDPLPVRVRRTQRIRIDVRFARRGRRVLEPSRVLVSDPLGIVVREIESAHGGELLVLPRIEPLLASGGHGASAFAAGAAAAPLALAAAELELDSLRPYRPGAPASRIHWPTAVRTGILMERRLLPDADSRPLVVLDPRRPQSDEDLDRAVRATASLCVHLARAGGCSLLLPGDRRAREIDPLLHAWPPLHARLALIEPVEVAPSVARLQRSGAIFWVTAGSVATAPQGLRRSGASARYLVTPSPVERLDHVFTVAGCSGHRLERGASRSAA